MKLISYHHFAAVVFLGLQVWALPADAQTVTWQALPFPSDSNWGGPTGQPASISATQVVLNAQPARSIESFAGPLTLTCDVTLQARSSDNGAFWMTFIPLGQPLNIGGFTNAVFFQLGYDNFSGDTMGFFARNGNPPNPPDSPLWTTNYPISAVTNYHLAFGLAANGALSLSINGQPISVPGAANLPISPFQIQIQGWQPGDIWTVKNFTVVPEPSTATLATLGIAGLAFITRRRRRFGG